MKKVRMVYGWVCGLVLLPEFAFCGNGLEKAVMSSAITVVTQNANPGPVPRVTTPAPIDMSAQAGIDLVNAYTDFLNIKTDEITEVDVKNFIVKASTVLIRYPKFIPTGKNYFVNETRIIFKKLFASIVHIVDEKDEDATLFLRSNNTEENEFTDMDEIRRSLSSAGLVQVQACMSGSPEDAQCSSQNPFDRIAKRFVDSR